MRHSRRHFLQILGATAGTAFALNESAHASPNQTEDPSKQAYGILNDGTLCVGCRSCEKACREFNNLPPLEPGPDGMLPKINGLDADTFSYVESRTVQSGGKDIQVYRRHMCNHCQHPSCASACPVGALTKSPLGPVYYRSERCIGCRYCINACPFTVPKYQWDTPKPFVRKCTMCGTKVFNGEPTSCSAACPTGAVKFGFRNDLLEEAHQRIDADPDNYNSTIFGEEIVGGTNVLYLTSSAIDLPTFGFPVSLGSTAYPEFTWAALSKVPGLAIYVVIWTSIVYFITHHRMPEEIRNLQAEEHHS